MGSFNWDTKYLIELAERHWHKTAGLIFGCAAAIIFGVVFATNIKADVVVTVLICSILGSSTLILWFYSNRIPKTPKGKVGFAVCIQYTNDEEQKVIREDFIKTLRKLLKGGSTGHTFHFIEIPQHIAESVNDNDDANILRSKTRSHFFIFGRVRLRKLEGKDCHVIELDGIVAHSPIKIEVSAQISKEFKELFPRRLHIPTENDLLTLSFTSEWTECVAKYIIGIASSCSADLNYAESLFRDIEEKLKDIKTNFPIYQKLRERLPIRFSEIFLAKAKGYLNEWRKSKNKESFMQFELNLNKINEKLANSYDVLLLRCIEAFLNGRRIKNAIEYINRCQSYDDPVWHFNLAFLKAYDGDLKTSIRHYRICANYDVSPVTLSEVEDFIVWILEEEPDKYQLHYCLGFFNWQIKGDLRQAVDDFKEFLSKAKKDEFESEQKLTKEWISEIKKQSKISPSENLNP